MIEHHPEPLDVIQLVESYVRNELDQANRYSNRSLLDEPGVWSLHALARAVYAHGVEDGVAQEYSRHQGQRQRDREQEQRDKQDAG